MKRGCASAVESKWNHVHGDAEWYSCTCSEDETIVQVLSLSQVPTSASSPSSLMAVLDLHTPLSYNMGWLLLLVEAGGASCRQSVSGSTAGVMAVGLLLLIEMGQSMRTVAESSFLFSGELKGAPCARTEDAVIWCTASQAPLRITPKGQHRRGKRFISTRAGTARAPQTA